MASDKPQPNPCIAPNGCATPRFCSVLGHACEKWQSQSKSPDKDAAINDDTTRTALVERLLALNVCDPECRGRCKECPADVVAEAARALTIRAATAAPSGWKLVPETPTQAMCVAAQQSWANDQGPKASTLWGSEAADIYRAMLKAAPSSPEVATMPSEEVAELRKALQWIADQVDSADADLDDIILIANRALAHPSSPVSTGIPAPGYGAPEGALETHEPDSPETGGSPANLWQPRHADKRKRRTSMSRNADLPKLLRACAGGTSAKESRQDVIFLAAAKEIEELRAVITARVSSAAPDVLANLEDVVTAALATAIERQAALSTDGILKDEILRAVVPFVSSSTVRDPSKEWCVQAANAEAAAGDPEIGTGALARDPSSPKTVMATTAASEGWQLVPVQITSEMHHAFTTAQLAGRGINGAWKAALAATPASNTLVPAPSARLIPLATEHLAKLPLPTGDYDADIRAIAATLTEDMIPPTPDGYVMVEWQINPPDDVYVLFQRAENNVSNSPDNQRALSDEDIACKFWDEDGPVYRGWPNEGKRVDWCYRDQYPDALARCMKFAQITRSLTSG